MPPPELFAALLSAKPLTSSQTRGVSCFLLRASGPSPFRWRTTAFLTLSLALVGALPVAPPRRDDEGCERRVFPEESVAPRFERPPDAAASMSRSPSRSVGTGRPLDRFAMPPREAALEPEGTLRELGPPRRLLGAISLPNREVGVTLWREWKFAPMGQSELYFGAAQDSQCQELNFNGRVRVENTMP